MACTFGACHEWGNIFPDLLGKVCSISSGVLFFTRPMYCWNVHSTFPPADTYPITLKKTNTKCSWVMNTLSSCKMIKYYSELRPLRVKRWSSFLVLLLVSPFLMWFIILLFGLCPRQLYNSLTPTHHSPSVRSYSWECGACSLLIPLSAIRSGKKWSWITAAKPSSPQMNDFHLLTLILMPSLKKVFWW